MLNPVRLLRRLGRLLRRDRLEAELEEELAFHLAMDAHRAPPDSPQPAHEARRRFGNVELIKEECRDARGTRPIEELRGDLRLAARSFRRSPGFAAAALLTLALGIGGPTAIFGAVRGMLLKPLPYAAPERIAFLWQDDRRAGNPRDEVSPANFLDWRERTTRIAHLAALEPHGLDWVGDAGPVYLDTWLVTEHFFDVLGTRPLLGRTFRPEDHRPGAPRVVVLGYHVWRTHFRGDPTVVGSVVPMDGNPTEIVGVMPPAFALPASDVVWAARQPQGWEERSRAGGYWTVIGRLRDDETLETAHAELATIAGQLATEHPTTNAQTGITLVPLPEQIMGRQRGLLFLLLGAVALVFCIACANLANLQLARAVRRGPEFAVRGALGAGGGRVLRQLLAEGTLLAVLGGLLGVGLAAALLGLVRRLAPQDLPRLSEVTLDGAVLGFAVLAAVTCAMVSGLLPGRHVLRHNLRGGLAGARTTTPGTRARAVRSGLVVAQIALSLILLLGTGLLLRSFVGMLREERGFTTRGVAMIGAQTWTYIPTPAARVTFVAEALQELQALPGVQAAAVASSIPLFQTIGAERATYRLPGEPAGEPDPAATVTVVTDDYFQTLEIPLRLGRGFEAADADTAVRHIIVNETLVRSLWPGGEDPVGRRILVAFQGPPTEREIIGVVGDVRRNALAERAPPGIYFPYGQRPTGATAYFVRTTGDPAALLGPMKQVLWRRHPTMPIAHEATLAAVVGESVREHRFLLTLLGLFAGLALALAAVGLFGVMSYITEERTREFGVRLAFGARREDITGMVLRQGSRLALSGVVLGLAGAAAGTRVLAGLLHKVAPLDPVTYAVGAGVLVVVGLLACWQPARRAASLDPIRALRSD